MARRAIPTRIVRSEASPNDFLDQTLELWESADDRFGLPDPRRVYVLILRELRGTLPIVESVPAGTSVEIPAGVLLVSAEISAADFARARRRALDAAGAKPAPKKRSAIADGRGWLDLIFLYRHYLARTPPAELARRYLRKGHPNSWARNDARARLTQRASDRIEAAERFIASRLSDF